MIETPRPSYRPLGDPDNLSLKEAGEILGKARNTVYLWYRQGKFPPAVDVGPHLHESKPVIVVPRYRLEAWLAGERMPSILQDVFDFHVLHEPPWGCWTAKKGAARKDIAFWVERREWTTGVSKGGRRIYGEALEEGEVSIGCSGDGTLGPQSGTAQVPGIDAEKDRDAAPRSRNARRDPRSHVDPSGWSHGRIA